MARLFKNSIRRAFMTGMAAAALPASVFGQQQTILPRYPRGAQAPPRLKYLITAQNSAAASLNALLTANTDFVKTNPRVAGPPHWRLRTHSCRALGKLAFLKISRREAA